MNHLLRTQAEWVQKRWGGIFARDSKYVIRTLGPGDAAAAHDIARGVDDTWNRVSALALSAEFGTSADRIALAREAAEGGGPMYMAPTLARLGALLYDVRSDDQTRAASAELFMRASNMIEAGRERTGEANGLAEYSFYAASRDPAAARLQLEMSWAQALSQTRETTSSATKPSTKEIPDKGNTPLTWRCASIAAAMAAIDYERALDMAHALPAERASLHPSPRDRALANIGRIALTPLEERWRFSWGDESGFDLH
jgi:hypothetical protein